ncbi:hypothetical protein CMQ_4647 [Grosmannia clavigera kw1407]|uniref:Uncharacterized protein n=1 Tax=Grosmannia clavigera (strain kw1407 / UAMH 11150) TaxID=655863 RepID=F0XUI6_GROCL|nr:uncharacterized protein CMQ_4647 [Grosmannia clavigera kw1407]EFW98795.1 hypothetical protein CMQ_4647 [Grosmannia clavigera kw1407]
MADILGTAATVLQLIGAIKTTWDFFDEMHKAPRTVLKYQRMIENLEITLQFVKDYYSLLSINQLANVQEALSSKHISETSIGRILDKIRQDLEVVSTELRKHSDNSLKLLANAKLVFRKASIVEAFENIEYEKSSLSLILGSIQGMIAATQFASIQAQTQRSILFTDADYVVDQLRSSIVHAVQNSAMFSKSLNGSSMNLLTGCDDDENYDNVDVEAGSRRLSLSIASRQSSQKLVCNKDVSVTLPHIDNVEDDGYYIQDADMYGCKSRFGSIIIHVSTYCSKTSIFHRPLINIQASLSLRKSSLMHGRVFQFRFQQVMHTSRLSGLFSSSSSGRIFRENSLAIQCIAAGNWQGIRDLPSRRQISVYDTDDYGRTYLHYAATHGLVDIAKTLIQEGADPGAKDHFATTPLDQLLMYGPGNSMLLSQIYSSANKDPLSRFVDCFYFLQFRGINPDCIGTKRGSDGISSRHSDMAALGVRAGTPGSQSAAVVQGWRTFISGVGANVNANLAHHNSSALSLLAASRHSTATSIQALLALGADVNYTDVNNMQPLHYFFHYAYSSTTNQPLIPSQRRAVQDKTFTLIEAGADLCFRDRWGRKPKHLAARAGLLDEYKEAVRRSRHSGLDSFAEGEEWHRWFDVPVQSKHHSRDETTSIPETTQLLCASQPPLQTSSPEHEIAHVPKDVLGLHQDDGYLEPRPISEIASHPWLPFYMLLRFAVFFLNSLHKELICCVFSVGLSALLDFIALVKSY